MKRITAVVMCLLLTLLLCACSDDGGSTSSAASSATASKQNLIGTEDTEYIEPYNPTSDETHVITDEGEKVDADNTYLSAIDNFVLKSGFLYNYMYADENGATVTAENMTDVDLAFALIFLLDSDSNVLSRETADDLIEGYFGIRPDHVITCASLISYDSEKKNYTLSPPDISGDWGTEFTELESLGNGYMRATGTADYNDDENGEQFLYNIEVLLVRDEAADYGFRFCAFSIRSAE